MNKCSSCPYAVHGSAACDCPFNACVLRAQLFEKVGEVIGDGGSFLLSLENQEEHVKDTDQIMGRWVCRIEELDEVTEE